MNFRKIILWAFAFLWVLPAHSQDLLSSLDSAGLGNQDVDYVSATFKSSRLINFHTIEVVGPKTLDFRISHRFAPINSGSYNAWGLDGPANIRLHLEYSPNGRFMAGLTRSNQDKTVDGFLKYKLLRQHTGSGMPITMTLFAGAYYTGAKSKTNGINTYDNASQRMSYNFQMMLARKFTPSFSVQVGGWYNHQNMVIAIKDKNDAYGVTGLTRLKFTKRSAITFEYGYRLNTDYSSTTKYYNSMGVGYELETGGHVFQIFLTNSTGMSENQYFDYTNNKWDNAGIALGFNISRFFTL